MTRKRRSRPYLLIVACCLLSGIGCQQRSTPPPPDLAIAVRACNAANRATDFSTDRKTRLALLVTAVREARIAAKHQPVLSSALLNAVLSLQRAELQLPTPVAGGAAHNGQVASTDQVRAYERALAGVSERCAHLGPG